VLLRAGGGDVEDAPLLLLGDLALARLDLGEALAVERLAAAQRRQPQPDHAVVGDAQRPVVVAAVLAEVGHAHDRELQPLGAVDRHQPDRVERLGLERGLALARQRGVALGDRVDETAQVAPLLGLVLARHAHQLAHVGHPPGAGGQGEHVAVVAGARDGAVDQRLERYLGGGAALGGEQLGEGGRAAGVGGRQELRELVLRLAQQPPWVAAGVPPEQADQGDGVERQPGERRRQHAVHRQLVERVRERGQPLAQVGDLLLLPVAAPADHVSVDPPLRERALVEAHVRGRPEQEHDVAPLPAALDAQLVDALGKQARLGGAPRRGGVHRGAERVVGAERLVPALLAEVGHQQLDRRGHARRLRLAARLKRLEALRPDPGEAAVDRLEHLGTAAEVDGDALRPPVGGGALPVTAEHLHVGVPEAVDRLVLVADSEQVVALEQLQQLVLKRVGVLELVDEHVLEALGVLMAQALVVAQQVAREQLEVLEVEPRAGALAPLVALPVQLEQGPQQAVVAVLAVLAAERGVGAESVAVLHACVRAERLGVAADREVPEVCRIGQLARGYALDQPERALELPDRALDGHAAAGAQLGQRRPCGGLEPGRRLRGRRHGQRLEPRPPLALAAQARVRGADHLADLVGGVRGDQLEPLGVGAHELLERRVERVGADPLRLQLVEHAEVGVDAGAERVGAQHARAEAVDRRDPGPLGSAGVGAPAQLDEAIAHARLHLGRRLLGERDRQHRLDRRAVLDHGAHEALDKHGRLARARAGAHDQRAVPAGDGALLLGGERGHPSHLQIDGYEQPPFQAHWSGSQPSSPPRMRASVSRTWARAQSSFARNSSGGSTSVRV
jgi:hypothetical protein